MYINFVDREQHATATPERHQIYNIRAFGTEVNWLDLRSKVKGEGHS